MPELPETETIARDLHGAICGASIVGVDVLRRDVLRGATAARLSRTLTARRIERVWRRAKSVVLSLDGGLHVAVTPRFTGALLIGAPAAVDEYACLRLSLDDGRELRYSDVRRLGTFALFDDVAFSAWSAALGPEPLDAAFTVGQLAHALSRTRRAVKVALMDQRLLAGVGNIYANEALWRARIRPTKRAASLTAVQCTALLRELTAVLHEAIAARGTSFRDYRDARGERGLFAAQLKAYGRGGAPCARCGEPLHESHALDGRTTVWCRSCQR